MSVPASLTIDNVRQAATDAARAVSPALEVAGVVLGGATDSQYVEIVVSVGGCRTPPCVVQVGAFRNVTGSAFRDEIARKLRDHMEKHGPPA